MFAVTVTFTVKSEHMAAFLSLVEENARRSLQEEEGCRRFDVCTDPARANEVFLYEIYTDRAAFDLHLESAHFRDFDAAVASMTAGKAVATYERVRS